MLHFFPHRRREDLFLLLLLLLLFLFVLFVLFVLFLVDSWLLHSAKKSAPRFAARHRRSRTKSRYEARGTNKRAQATTGPVSEKNREGGKETWTGGSKERRRFYPRYSEVLRSNESREVGRRNSSLLSCGYGTHSTFDPRKKKDSE